MIVIYLWVGASVFMFLLLLGSALKGPTTVADVVMYIVLWFGASIFAPITVWPFLYTLLEFLLGPTWNKVKDKQLIKERK